MSAASSPARRSRRQQFDRVQAKKLAGNKLQEEEDRVRAFYKEHQLEWGQDAPSIELDFEQFNTSTWKPTDAENTDADAVQKLPSGDSPDDIDVGAQNASPLATKFGPGGVVARAFHAAADAETLARYRISETESPLAQKFGGEAGVVGQAMQSIQQAGDFATYKAAVTESPLVQNFGGESGVVGKAMRSIRQGDDFSAYKAAETDSPLVDKFGGPTGVYGKAVRSAIGAADLARYRNSSQHPTRGMKLTGEVLWKHGLKNPDKLDRLGRFAPKDGIVARLSGRSPTHVVIDGTKDVKSLVGPVRLGEMIDNGIFKAIEGLRHISVLDINRSNTTRIPVSFRSWPKLVSLSLVNGKIEELPECIGACGPTLELLNLHGNKLESLPPSISKLTKLRRLWIGNNRIGELAMEMFSLFELEELIFHGNQIRVIPKEINSLRKLRLLGGDRNRIDSLPPEIGDLHALRVLSLRDNRLTMLPPEFSQLQALEILKLSDNRLTRLHGNMHQHTKLWVLDLCGNMLRALPDELLQLKHLSGIEVDNNPMQALKGSWLYEEDQALKFITMRIDEEEKEAQKKSLEDKNALYQQQRELAMQSASLL